MSQLVVHWIQEEGRMVPWVAPWTKLQREETEPMPLAGDKSMSLMKTLEHAFFPEHSSFIATSVLDVPLIFIYFTFSMWTAFSWSYKTEINLIFFHLNLSKILGEDTHSLNAIRSTTIELINDDGVLNVGETNVKEFYSTDVPSSSRPGLDSGSVSRSCEVNVRHTYVFHFYLCSSST